MQVRVKRSQYQQGSIKKVRRVRGYAWEVRFSDWTDGKRHQRTLTFSGSAYPAEADVRKAIELTVSQINSGTAGENVDAEFSAIVTLYRERSLPSERKLFERKQRLRKLLPMHFALIDAFTIAFRQDLRVDRYSSF